MASFILAEAKLDGPARSSAELSPLVSEVPFDEARAWILGSASIEMSSGFVGQGWKFWPVSRPGIVAWPVFDKVIGLRSPKGSLRSLLVVCHPDRSCAGCSCVLLLSPVFIIRSAIGPSAEWSVRVWPGTGPPPHHPTVWNQHSGGLSLFRKASRFDCQPRLCCVVRTGSPG